MSKIDWQKMLSDLSVTTEKPIDISIIYLAMMIDLYQSTNNNELKRSMEEQFINMFKIK
jgi:hypothetical protein